MYVCQRCGRYVSEVASTIFHNEWCYECINDLIDQEEEAIKELLHYARVLERE